MKGRLEQKMKDLEAKFLEVKARKEQAEAVVKACDEELFRHQGEYRLAKELLDEATKVEKESSEANGDKATVTPINRVAETK